MIADAFESVHEGSGKPLCPLGQDMLTDFVLATISTSVQLHVQADQATTTESRIRTEEGIVVTGTASPLVL